MKEMPKTGALIRFDCNAEKGLVGYVTGKDEYTDMLRVCTAPGKYYWVDRCLAEAV